MTQSHPQPHRDRSRLRARRARLGFTLLELMVAGTAGAIVVSSMFFISSASTNFFREQQRVSNMQSSLRYAMDQIRRDVSRAGFGATPAHGFGDYRSQCNPGGGLQGPAAGTPFQAIQVLDAQAPAALIDPAGPHLIDGVAIEGDTLNLLGNYSTPSEYRLAGGLLAGGGQVALATDWMTFTRDFTAWVGGPPYITNAALFNAAFLPGRLVRVRATTGDRFFSTVAGTNIVPPRVTLGTAINGGNCAFDASSVINPVSMMQYVVLPAAGVTAHANPAVSGVNAQLIRQELGFGLGGAILAGTTPRIVAERVVHFSVDLLVNQTADRTATPVIAPAVGANAAAAPPQQIFSAIVTLAVRAPMADRTFPWVLQGAGEELTRYRFSPLQAGASRVRIARSEIFLPNVAYEWID